MVRPAVRRPRRRPRASAATHVEATSPVNHPWWYAIAAGLLAATLVETGDRAEAEAVARRGLAVGETAMAGGRLRCLAAVAGPR